MNLELVSFPICPFVQRAVIALKEKEVPFEITYIDVHNPPEWFPKISPFGKVPLLKVDGEVLFESAIINEFLDEMFSPQLHPADPMQRAKHRGWIEFGSNLILDQAKLLLAKSEDELQQAVETLGGHFARLRDQVSDEGPYYSGSNFSLLDCAYAPLFMRFNIIAKHHDACIDCMPTPLQRWSEALLARPSVVDSVVDDFETRYVEFFKTKGSYILGGGD